MSEISKPAETIAADLALAIHQGSIQPGAQLPSQSHLAKAYGVAMGTAASAMSKLQTAGLVTTVPGAGTYATIRRTGPSPVLDILAAASMCRALASITFGPADRGPDARPTLEVGGDPNWDDPHRDPEKMLPPRQVNVTELAGLDRHLLRWMSEALLSAARRVVGSGVVDTDEHLVAAARAILRDGARRPENQPGIAHLSGKDSWDEDVTLRIWPERAESQWPASWPEGAPF